MIRPAQKREGLRGPGPVSPRHPRTRDRFGHPVLTDYLRAALREATYEILPNGEGFYGEIPGFQGVYANADTLEAGSEAHVRLLLNKRDLPGPPFMFGSEP